MLPSPTEVYIYRFKYGPEWIEVQVREQEDGKRFGSCYNNFDLDDGVEPEWSAAVSGLESFLLALACEGVDINTEQFHKAVSTTLEMISNQYS